MLSVDAVVLALQEATDQANDTHRRHGEALLENWSRQPGFLTHLLEIYRRQDLGDSVRLLAVIQFKNIVDSKWARGASGDLLPEEKAHIRSRVLDIAMEPQPLLLQRQFAVAVGKIARQEFPRGWPDLFGDMGKRIAHLAPSPVSEPLRNLLNAVNQIVKSIAPSRIGPARGQFNEISPKFLDLVSGVYFHLMSNLDSSPTVAPIAYSALKISGSLIYQGNDRMHRYESAQQFFAQAVNILKKLMSVEMSSPNADLRKHIRRFGKIFTRLSDRYPVAFCMMPNALEVAEFYRGIVVSHGKTGYQREPTNDNEAAHIALLDNVAIQGMLLLRDLVKVSQRDPQQRGTTMFPINMRPRDDLDKEDLCRIYKLTREEYFSKDDVSLPLLYVCFESYFVMRRIDLELWSGDQEEFINEDVLATAEFKVSRTAQLLFHHLLDAFPTMGTPALQFVESTIAQESTELQDILLLDSALQVIEHGSRNFNKIWKIEPFLTDILAPRLMSVVLDSYRIIRRRVSLLLAEWLPLQGNQNLSALVYQLAVGLMFPKSPLNDLPVQLAALQAVKVAVDDVDFEYEGFAPYAESTFEILYELINNAVDGIEIKRYLLEVLSVLVEQMGHRLEARHLETILTILPPLWEEKTESQLIKAVIIQTLTHLVDAAREKSPLCYPFARKVLQATVSPSEPLFSYLSEDALGLWKSLIVNAEEPAPELLYFLPHLLNLLMESTEHMSEELSLLESYTRLQPDAVAETSTLIKVFSLFASYLPDSGAELAMSFLQCVLVLAELRQPRSYISELKNSGLHRMMILDVVQAEEDPAQILLELKSSKIFDIFAWISFYEPSLFHDLVLDALPEQDLFPMIVNSWLRRATKTFEPRSLKLHCLGVSSCLLAQPDLFLRFPREFEELWAGVLDEVNETNGDAEVYYSDMRYPGESEKDLTPEQLRTKAASSGEPIHKVELRTWISDIAFKLQTLPDPQYQQELGEWASRVFAHRR